MFQGGGAKPKQIILKFRNHILKKGSLLSKNTLKIYVFINIYSIKNRLDFVEALKGSFLLVWADERKLQIANNCSFEIS